MGDNPTTNSDSNGVRNGEDSCADYSSLAAFVDDFLRYKLGEAGYEWRSSVTRNVSSTHQIAFTVGMTLRALTDEFSSRFKEHFVEMWGRLGEVNAEKVKPTMDGIADELFSEGITWSRVVALFSFGSELALQCRIKNTPDDINVISQTLTSYVSEKLLPWINDHGGWEGLVHFNEGLETGKVSENSWPSVKNLLCLGISALGAITLGAVLTKS